MSAKAISLPALAIQPGADCEIASTVAISAKFALAFCSKMRGKTLDQKALRDLAQRFLVPFFSGAKIEEKALTSNERHKLVALVGPCRIAFKVEPDDDYRLVLIRSQPFTKSRSDKIPEQKVIEAFVDTLSSIKDHLSTEYAEDLLGSFQRRIIARSLTSSLAKGTARRWQKTILRAIDQLSSWSSRLYEGSPVSATIGLRHIANDTEGRPTLADVASLDVGAVISNGHDTIVTYNYANSALLSHEALDVKQALPSYCPLRQAQVAEWTTVHERRIAISLNRLGEILIYHDHKLVFARRSGRWHFMTHIPVVTQMHVPQKLDIRRKIYETCLDASFARTGACIGVVQIDQKSTWSAIVDPDDILPTSTNLKARSLRIAITGSKFQDLDRRIRQELVAIDGATIISHRGDILAVGAILKIKGGSEGGGRLAAAKALSRYGLGIKVSQDGGILGYRHDDKDAAFQIMT